MTRRALYQKKRFLLPTGGILLLILVLFLLPSHLRQEILEYARNIDLYAWRDAIRGTGLWAPLIVLAVYTLVTVAFLPTTLMTIVATLVFGPFKGLAVSLGGLFLGVSTSFFIARHIGTRILPAHILHAPLAEKLDRKIKRDGWKIVFITRLFPINPFTLLNYLYGLTSISYRPFIISTLIGVTPITSAYVWLTHETGKLAAGQKLDWRILVSLAAAALLFAALTFLPRLLKSKPQNSRAPN